MIWYGDGRWSGRLPNPDLHLLILNLVSGRSSLVRENKKKVEIGAPSTESTKVKVEKKRENKGHETATKIGDFILVCTHESTA